ncbi:MAG: 2-hydroxy-acid oxidase [Planctomycetaceae bacterium]|nr:2-hydroxy-acid oxidase [Planctomycetaceae bacterium]
MHHKIQLDQLNAAGPSMVKAVEACVHCGFCLSSCPTYRVLGQEMDSPRGRIILMKQVLEGDLHLNEVSAHIDPCLGCLACVTACPSGVQYGDLVGPFRETLESQGKRSLTHRLRQSMMMRTLPYPGRFRWAARMGRLAKPFTGIMPKPMRAMLELLPARLPPRDPLPRVNPPQAKPRARVAMLTGCVQSVIEPQISRATLDVLQTNGVEVHVPPDQGCCGALAWHNGHGALARRQARHNLNVFSDSIDAVISNAAGCGSGMHEYPLMFKGTPDEHRARQFADRVVDVSVFLDNLGLTPPPPLDQPITIAYHDACHLAHAQGVRDAPRNLLNAIEGVTVVEIPNGEFCCGSAGTYNIDHPDVAAELGRHKVDHIRATGADLVVAGNIGCLVQIQQHLKSIPDAPRLMHTMTFLQSVYAGSF